MMVSSLALLVVSLLLVGQSKASEDLTARVESCSGCSLNRLPEVKSFIYDDLPKYDIEFKRIHGAPPELVLSDAAGEEVERIPLTPLNRAQCNELLVSKGFARNVDSDKTEL